MDEIEFVEQFFGTKLKLYQKMFLKLVILKDRHILKKSNEMQVLECLLKEIDKSS